MIQQSVVFEGRRFSKWVKFGLPLIGLTCFWLLNHEAPLLFTSFMISWGLYYLLNPMVDYLERHSIRRGLASIIILFGFILIIYVVWLRFLTFSSDLRTKVDLDTFQRNIVNRLQSVGLWLENKVPTVKRYIQPEAESVEKTGAGNSKKVIIRTQQELDQLEAVKLRTVIEEKLNSVIKKIIFEEAPDLLRTILGLIPNLILIPYFTFFFLKDGRFFKKTMIEWIPNRYFEPALKFFFEMSRRMRSYLQSTLLDCLLVGVFVGIGSYFVGAPYPVVLGTIAFIFNTIPLLGPLIYGAICIVIPVAAGKSTDVIIGSIGVFVISRIFDDLFFTPVLYGKSHHLHPVVVVCSVLLGESIAGAWGMFLAIPITSLLILGASIIREISIGEDAKPLPDSFAAPFS
jgi:predicted PurR-regulated permease PerM